MYEKWEKRKTKTQNENKNDFISFPYKFANAQLTRLGVTPKRFSCSLSSKTFPAALRNPPPTLPPRFPASMLHANEDVNLSLGCSSEPAAATPAVTAFKLVNLSKSELRQNRERERERAGDKRRQTQKESERGGEWKKCTEQVTGKHTLTQIRLELKVLTEFHLDFVFKYFQKFLRTLKVSNLKIYVLFHTDLSLLKLIIIFYCCFPFLTLI